MFHTWSFDFILPSGLPKRDRQNCEVRFTFTGTLLYMILNGIYLRCLCVVRVIAWATRKDQQKFEIPSLYIVFWDPSCIINKPQKSININHCQTTTVSMVFQGNDTEGSGFSKKPKKRKHNNPLSQARGKQNKHENVWFRRSKAGYSLFVQYYMGQPIGTISSAEGKLSLADKEDMGSQKNSSDTNSGSNLIKTGKGMSRAAKRRNKKKDKRQNGPAISKDTSSTVPRSEVTVSTTLSNEDPPSLLESAYSRLLATDKAASHHNNFEFKAFLQAMSRRLPLSFRIRQYENDSERDETDFDKAIARLGEQEFLDLVEAIPFGNTTLYRAHSTKSLSSTTEVLCKARLNIVSPALKEFLVKTSQSGVLARQEIGSMLPVMALYDVGGLRAGSTVLDVCASPGSKTLQALEIIGPKGR